jgi:tetrahydromethanopterin S-methyltransferase subunit E
MLISPVRHVTGGGQRQQPVYNGIVVKFFISLYGMGEVVVCAIFPLHYLNLFNIEE